MLGGCGFPRSQIGDRPLTCASADSLLATKYGCHMELNEIPPVLSVKEFCSIILKSKSWAYAEWKKEASDLPKPFKIGSATRILGEATVAYLKKKSAT